MECGNAQNALYLRNSLGYSKRGHREWRPLLVIPLEPISK